MANIDPAPTSILESLRLFGRLLRLVQAYWHRLTASILIGLMMSLLGLIPPLLTKTLVDEVYASKDTSLLQVVLLGSLGLTIGSATIGAIRGYHMQVVSGQLGHATSLMFFNHLVHQPVRFFDQHRVGELLSRLGDVKASLGTISRTFGTLLTSGLQLLVVPPVLLYLNWRLSLVAVIALPISSTVSLLASRLMRKFGKLTAEQQADVSAFQIDTLSQIRTLKLLHAESFTYQRISTQSRDLFRTQLRTSALSAVLTVVRALIDGVGTFAFMWYGWMQILAGELTLGSLLAFSAYLRFMTGPLTSMSSLFTDFQQSAIALGRMFEYLDATPEFDPAAAYFPKPPLTMRLHGLVECRGVSFGYLPDCPVLSAINLRLERGSVTAVVGPSGAGKSSLVRLLARLEEPSSGGIFFDGLSSSELDLAEFRRQLSVVWQEVGLIRGTLFENLTLGSDNVTREVVMSALRACQLTELIATLPDGLDTPIAEWGATLSGGQRQRVALARALIRDTPLIVLDEATANIDVSTERKLLTELIAFAAGKTIVFVTHRVQTASLAQNVCVLSMGSIVGFGAHEHLMKSCDVYRELADAAIQRSDVRPLRVV